MFYIKPHIITLNFVIYVCVLMLFHILLFDYIIYILQSAGIKMLFDKRLHLSIVFEIWRL